MENSCYRFQFEDCVQGKDPRSYSSYKRSKNTAWVRLGETSRSRNIALLYQK